MQRDFDLNSQKWLSLIFEDKNKQYGAYVHRGESSDRHLKSLIIVTLVALGVIFLPKLIKTMMPADRDLGQVTEVILDNIVDNELSEENTIKEIVVPPPPELKSTVAFTPPVIVEDEKIVEEQIMLTQQELTDTQAQISVVTVVGSETGVDIADLADHKVIVEEPAKPTYFHHVEVMPSFPGGDGALMQWLGNNIIYPTIAQEQGISGQVVLRFVVTPDGSIEDVEVMKSLDPSCDREAQNKVKRMPKWNPGKQNGNPVYVYFTLPVRFKLQNQ